MKMIDYLKEVSQKATNALADKHVNDETTRDHLKRIFNIYHQSFNMRYLWPWRTKSTIFQTVANYDTGTVTVSKGSRTVTGSSNVSFTTDMIDRFFKLKRDNELYQILDVPTGLTFTLKTPYIRDDAATQSYIVWKKLYDLDPDIPYLGNINFFQWPNISKTIPKKEFDILSSNSYLSGNPSVWTWHGINKRILTYNAGTVSTTKDSKTLTGNGTSFLDNAFGGSKITIDNDIYNVESVNSNTSITMVQNAINDFTNKTYKIESMDRSQIALSNVPDPIINIGVNYYKKTYDYVNDNDEVEIWNGFKHPIIDAMYGHFIEKLTSERPFQWLTVFNQETERVWRSLQDAEQIDSAVLFGANTFERYRTALYG